MGGTGNTTLWGSTIPGGLPSAAFSGQTIVSDIIYMALRQAGILRGARRGPSSSEYADGFDCLNRMIESWNTDRLIIYSVQRALHVLTAGKQSYTIGQDPAGLAIPDFDVARPIRIDRANVISGGSRQQLDLLNYQQWAESQLEDGRWTLYNDGAHPLSTLYLGRAVASADQLELFAWQALSTFTGPTENVILPPGYARALVSNLALELCVTFGVDPRPLLVKVATEAKAAIESLNAPTPAMACDSAVLSRSFFDWRTGR